MNLFKKYLGCLIPMLIFVIAFICIEWSKNKEKETESSAVLIGKYVYMDTDGILHTKNRCVVGMQVTESDESSYYKGIEFIDTTNLSVPQIKNLCSWCVTDEHYEILLGITERNRAILRQEEDDEYWEQFVIKDDNLIEIKKYK